MRGKLRDKRADLPRDSFRRDLADRRRSQKRSDRTLAWLNQQLDEDEENYLEDGRAIAVRPGPAK